MVARRRRAAQLQPVERAFAGQRRTIPAARRQLAGQHRQRRVVAQLVVIDQILITQRNPEHALSDQRLDRVLDQRRRAAIGETRGKPLNQADRPIRRPQQQRPASEVIRPPSNPATTARRSTGANPNRSALHSVCIGSPPGPETNRCDNSIFSIREPDAPIRCEKSRLIVFPA